MTCLIGFTLADRIIISWVKNSCQSELVEDLYNLLSLRQAQTDSLVRINH
jgi:hypothetical protein